MGPLVNKVQYGRVQRLIELGVSEGATLVTGGAGLPDGFDTGYYIKPTVFADVTSNMAIAKEEIFGPVLSILFYDTEEEAIKIANDTVYGLPHNVQSATSRTRNASHRRSARDACTSRRARNAQRSVRRLQAIR